MSGSRLTQPTRPPAQGHAPARRWMKAALSLARNPRATHPSDTPERHTRATHPSDTPERHTRATHEERHLLSSSRTSCEPPLVGHHASSNRLNPAEPLRLDRQSDARFAALRAGHRSCSTRLKPMEPPVLRRSDHRSSCELHPPEPRTSAARFAAPTIGPRASSTRLNPERAPPASPLSPSDFGLRTSDMHPPA